MPHSLDADDWKPWPNLMDEQFSENVRVVIQGCHDDARYYGFAFRGDEMIAREQSLSVAGVFNKLTIAIQGGA